jgi:hypothetical protein
MIDDSFEPGCSPRASLSNAAVQTLREDLSRDATQFEADASAARMVHDSVIIPISRDAPGIDAAHRPCDGSAG